MRAMFSGTRIACSCGISIWKVSKVSKCDLKRESLRYFLLQALPRADSVLRQPGEFYGEREAACGHNFMSVLVM